MGLGFASDWTCRTLSRSRSKMTESGAQNHSCNEQAEQGMGTRKDAEVVAAITNEDESG